MSLINDTYFSNKVNLPISKYKDLQGLIDRYETEIVNQLLGYTLGAEVLEYDTNTSTQRIKDIVEGKIYTISSSSCGFINPSGNDISVKWNGLINNEKISLIADYCYYWWCRENETFITNSGGAKAKLENAENIGLNKKASTAWHDMLHLYGFPHQDRIAPSCYNFIYNFKETYPEWVFKIKEPITMLGI